MPDAETKLVMQRERRGRELRYVGPWLTTPYDVPFERYLRGETADPDSIDRALAGAHDHVEDPEEAGGCICGRPWPCAVVTLATEVTRLTEIVRAIDPTRLTENVQDDRNATQRDERTV